MNRIQDVWQRWRKRMSNNQEVLKEMEAEWEKELKRAHDKRQAWNKYIENIQAKLNHLREAQGECK